MPRSFLILISIALLLCASLGVQYINQANVEAGIERYTATRHDDLSYSITKAALGAQRLALTLDAQIESGTIDNDKLQVAFYVFSNAINVAKVNTDLLEQDPNYDPETLATADKLVTTYGLVIDNNPTIADLKNLRNEINALTPDLIGLSSIAVETYADFIHVERLSLGTVQRKVQIWTFIQAVMVLAFAAITFWMFARAHQSRRRLVEEERRAAAEAERSAALHENSRILELLGRIGQDITATLKAEAGFAALGRHIGELLDVDKLFIGEVSADKRSLNVNFAHQNGERVPPFTIPLDDPHSTAALCYRERREILVEKNPETAPDDGSEMQSLFYRFLDIGEDAVGVISVQSRKPHAYGDNERFIVRTLCAYGAIALANARTYDALAEAMEDLRETQAQLVQQEKLASLGQMVAGIAHEVNTPVGIVVSAASQIVDEVTHLKTLSAEGRMRRTDFEEFLEVVSEGANHALRNAERAAQLISTFKQVAVDRTAERPREINLKGYVGDVLHTLHPMLGKSQIQTEIAGDDDILLFTIPGPLAQVLTNLVANAVLHAFGNRTGGWITITIDRDRSDVARLTLADNGNGMSERVAEQAFEPFFTTRRNAGGTGLGLHIVHNIVTGALAGTIAMTTSPGVGTRFTITLPSLPPVESDASRPGETVLPSLT
jgi:signal transduction histidine kinase